MVEKALYAYLVAEPNVSALVESRVFPLVADQDATFPHIAFTRTSTEFKHVLGGASHHLPKATIQVACWDLRHDAAWVLANTVAAALDGFSGSSYGSVNVHKVFLRNMFDGFEFLTEGKEKPAYHVTIEVEAWYRDQAS